MEEVVSPQTPLKADSLDFKQNKKRGVKRVPSTPLTPLINRFNAGKRRLIDEKENQEDLNNKGSPVPRKNPAPAMTQLEDNYRLIEEMENNWVLRKQNERLQELVDFMEIEAKLRKELAQKAN